MPFHYNIEKDYLYKTGVERGIEKGIERGMTQKEFEKNSQFVKSLLLNTTFDKDKIAQLAAVDKSFVETIAKELGL